MGRLWLLIVFSWAAACGDGSNPASAGAPTFAADIAPIIYSSCTPCHRDGETTPFSLLGYEDVRKRRKQILRVVEDRIMPPWLPSHGDFLDDRRLEPEQIALLRRWVEADAPRGDVAAEPRLPDFPSGWQLREPDLVLSPANDVVVPASGPDEFRNLVIPVETDRVRYVAAVEIRPGNPSVHHAVLAVDATTGARRLDELDPRPGFAGMSAGAAEPPDGQFLGWTPGKRVHEAEPGMGWRLIPGTDLVLQLHVTTTGKEERVRPRIGFYFTDVPVRVVTFPFVMFSDDIDIAAGDDDFVLRDHIVLPVPVVVHSIYPHAHYVCRRMRATLTFPDGQQRDLFRIDRWDFDWQDDYRFREPVALPAGTRVDFEYRYDNSDDNPNNPFHPPRRVRFGQESTDEMGTLTLQLTLKDIADRQRLAEANMRRDLEKLGYDAPMLCRLTGLLREMNRNEEALTVVAQVLEREPGNAQALAEYGMCLAVAGRMPEAERALAASVQLDPSQNNARMRLAGLMARSGRTGPAIELFEAALDWSPNLAALHNNLATAYFAEGRLDRAAATYRRAVQLDEKHFGAWFNLGRVLAAMGRTTQARQALLRARTLRPGAAVVEQALRELDG